MELTLRPASLPWLVEHEVRLAWRGLTNGQPRTLIILLAFVLIAMHGLAFLVLSEWPADAGLALSLPALGAVMGFSASLMLAQAIARSVSALFDRGDLDLLMSSPLPTQHVFVARGLGIAISLLPFQLCLLAPFANVGLLMHHAHLMAVYPVLMADALCMTAVGMGLTLTLVRLLGARRARTAAQLFGSVVGALFFLLTQAQTLLSPAQHARWNAQLSAWTQPGGLFAPDSLLLFPARALLGEALPLGALVLLGIASFGLMVRTTHRQFVAGTQASLADRRARPAPRSGSLKFSSGVARNMLVKEWRLILRDPQLISKTLMQVLYLIPLTFLMLRGGDSVQLLAAIMMLALTLTSALAWITVTAEDAPQLLGSAPVSFQRLQWLKVLAAVLPVWLLLLPIPAYLALQSPWTAALMALCLGGGGLNVAACQIWYPRTGRRDQLAKRGQGNGIVSILDLLVTVGWVGLLYTVAKLSPYAGLALLLIGIASGSVWWLGRERRAGTVAG